ncbi:unnamed protein product [Cyprideis torosa]|uniref:tRNA pseudouridine(55) synthase n=1 Tax=Cyprideis torosa TaxID=163714 RepID=A0A7R8W8F4_9CRUS|nr:unnamed protein product [Cyprideis torosa]CAG0888506.1 unnamed protein product [Cyprideis torosa]
MEEMDSIREFLRLEVGVCAECTNRFISWKGHLGSSSSCEATEAEDPEFPLTKKIRLDTAEEEKKNASTDSALCQSCLEVFSLESAVERISCAVSESGMEIDRYQVNLSIPTLVELRQLAVASQLQQRLGCSASKETKTIPYVPSAKKLLLPLLLQRLKGIFPAAAKAVSGPEARELDSVVSINVTWDHPDDAGVCKSLQRQLVKLKQKKKLAKDSDSWWGSADKELCPDKGRNQSLALIESGQVPIQDILAWPLPKSSQAVTCRVSVKRSAVYLAGRYVKLSRQLPQTPWLVGTVRKMEDSVEELIVNPVKSSVRFDSARFSSSGREDCDVRMLGTGRPFALEIRNLRSLADVEPRRCKELERAINESGADRVQVRDLCVVSREDVNSLHKGEGRAKNYVALCRLADGHSVERESLDKICDAQNLVLQQKTPLRVLHRRTNMVRERTIYTMSPEMVADLERPNSIFTLRLRTDAGTYIKEFVHGDLGRTQPNLCSMLGVPVDIVALDCSSVEMDWPPERGPPASPHIPRPQLHPIFREPQLHPIFRDPQLHPIFRDPQLHPPSATPQLHLIFRDPQLHPIFRDPSTSTHIPRLA